MKKYKMNLNFMVDNPNLYRIAFKDRKTQTYGGSLFDLSREEAQATAVELNAVHPDREYWIEQNPRLN
ncbi:hypothetical protein QNI19_32295 [Cytophagaceae bacterium DM2B3-1]|uniref:Uncharacterized protein n=1 Tax=Xanthocytophaga flava TaxID=3048013 RepID=A0ABT7CVC3_9BACT|nr:hypothetical protein [Xanthocytophaga flavus]MDJ1497665.1 hypothetical protein [Xanthocytophaga flavus]